MPWLQLLCRPLTDRYSAEGGQKRKTAYSLGLYKVHYYSMGSAKYPQSTTNMREGDKSCCQVLGTGQAPPVQRSTGHLPNDLHKCNSVRFITPMRAILQGRGGGGNFHSGEILGGSFGLTFLFQHLIFHLNIPAGNRRKDNTDYRRIRGTARNQTI
jgi:hypothetical protein